MPSIVALTLTLEGLAAIVAGLGVAIGALVIAVRGVRVILSHDRPSDGDE